MRFAACMPLLALPLLLLPPITVGPGGALAAQQSNRPAVRGRLLDAQQHPLAGATLRMCQEGRQPGPSDGWGFSGRDQEGAEIFQVPDKNGITTTLRRTEHGETTYFLQYRDSTWANTETDLEGRFTFQGALPPGTYCLAALTPGTFLPRKLHAADGTPVKVTVADGKPGVDAGDVVVPW